MEAYPELSSDWQLAVLSRIIVQSRTVVHSGPTGVLEHCQSSLTNSAVSSPMHHSRDRHPGTEKARVHDLHAQSLGDN